MGVVMGGGYDLGEDLELSNLPEEAFDNTLDVNGPFEPDDRWLKDADKDQQRIALRGWFLMRYCDPVAVGTPYNKELGYGFVTANAGPFDARDELEHRFGDIVEGGLISDVAFELSAEGGEVWARRETRTWDDYCDPRFGLEIDSWSDPNLRLQNHLSEAMKILDLEGGPDTLAIVRNLVFFSLISALEAYLWETVVFLIENHPPTLKDVITKVAAFHAKEKSVTLAEAFELQGDGFKKKVKDYLIGLSWHDVKKVAPLFKTVLAVPLNSWEFFKAAVGKRHHIVHRSGRDHDGIAVDVTRQEIERLNADVHEFAGHIYEQVKNRFQNLEPDQD
jgi:hypothetical protein